MAKTCKFYSDDCSQKSICDQIIEGLLDGDVVEDLLKDKELTSADTISRCRAQKAAKQQRAEITHIPLENTFVQTVKRPYHAATSWPPQPIVATCPGCGSGPHQGGCQSCPAYQVICHNCHKNGHFARVCRSRRQPQILPNKSSPITSAVTLEPHVRTATTIEPAPTITIHICLLNGSAPVTVLQDSGAEISIAGHHLLQSLNEHKDNLLPSHMSP